MKKLILPLTFILMLTTNGNAQETTHFVKKLFGFRAGFTSSNLRFSANGVSVSANSKLGFYAGEYAELGITENFAVQPEISYSLVGAKFSDPSKGTDNLNLGYLNVPVLAKYVHNGMSVILGPQVGFLLKEKDKSYKFSVNNLSDLFKTADIAEVIGIGFTTQSGLGYNARYLCELKDIGLGDPYKTTTSAFTIGLHYTLMIGCQVDLRPQ